jgi:hypothetical protein
MNPAYRPMLATLVDEPFDDNVTLWSRNEIDHAAATLNFRA